MVGFSAQTCSGQSSYEHCCLWKTRTAERGTWAEQLCSFCVLSAARGQSTAPSMPGHRPLSVALHGVCRGLQAGVGRSPRELVLLLAQCQQQRPVASRCAAVALDSRSSGPRLVTAAHPAIPSLRTAATLTARPSGTPSFCAAQSQAVCLGTDMRRHGQDLEVLPAVRRGGQPQGDALPALQGPVRLPLPGRPALCTPHAHAACMRRLEEVSLAPNKGGGGAGVKAAGAAKKPGTWVQGSDGASSCTRLGAASCMHIAAPAAATGSSSTA